jgi:hypothetical protein
MRPTLGQMGSATAAAIVVFASFLLIAAKTTTRAKPSKTRADIVYFGVYRQACPPEPALSKQERAKAIVVVDWPRVCPFEIVIPHG